MLKIVFYCVLIFLMIASLLLVIFWWQIRIPFNENGGSPGGEAGKVIFKVEKGQSAETIAGNLVNEGLIENPFIFRLYVFLAVSQYALKTGEYELSPAMSIREIADAMILGGVNEILITIPEGFSLRQIEERLVSAGLAKSGQLISFKYSENTPSILSDKPKSSSLEGYLFPDSYRFFKDADLPDIIGKMIGNLDKKLTPDFKLAIKNSGYTTYEILTMASLVEKEIRNEADRSTVAGILWKRLEAKIPLQVDATLIYVTDRNEIFQADKKINSPYNTYYYRGLPKGPIANPGLSAIKAAIFPKPSPYWYYLSAKDGATIFSKTLEEHNRNKAIYLK